MPWTNEQRLEWGLDHFSHEYGLGWRVAKNGVYEPPDDERSKAMQRILGIPESKIGHIPFETLFGTNDHGDHGWCWHPSLYWSTGHPIVDRQRKSRHLKALAEFRRTHHPAGTMHANRAGVMLIERFEGYFADPYDDGTGTWTIGYGHTGSDVFHLGHLSAGQAESLLYSDLRKDYEPAVRNAIVKNRLTQGVMNGLTSFVFNVGVGNLTGQDDIAGKVNRGDLRGAAREMMAYVQPFPAGLKPRRRAEVAQLLS